MTENDLYSLVFAVLGAGFTAYGLPAVDFRQLNQPRVTGTPDGYAVFLSIVSPGRRYGFLKRSDVWHPEANPPVMIHTETQAMQVRMQCNALSPIAPPEAPKPAFAAGDLVAYASAVLQSDAGNAQLQAAGVGIERITDLRSPYFKDERDQFEASPSFDFLLDFNWSLSTTTPIISATELRIVPV